MALTIKQEKFCIEYAKSGNARQAYIEAGYKCNSDEAADANASRLLRKDKVKERLAELTEEVKNASCNYKQVPNRVEPFHTFHSVEEDACCINNSS